MEKREIKTDNFSVCQSTSHKNGIRKGDRYGGHLFEFEEGRFTENQNNDYSSGI